ncbi:MAG: FG-GAP repeat protein [Candidatus Aminicenantes bacterium]|nr:FG-GAP repeat protein [Candidatus Aminicenantes bacterium]
MRMRSVLTVILAGIACLLLAGCQAKDEVMPETTFRSLLKLVASDTADNTSFGMSGDVDGDLAIVGAPGDDVNGTNSGAAYIFSRDLGGLDGWGQIKKLVASDAAADDLFGVSVDISGDYAVVGAVAEDGAGTGRGAAYIFYRNQGGADNWGQVKKLTANAAADNDGFGFAVALEGDTLIVGADGEDGGGTDEGAAYVFYKDRGGADNWGPVVRLVAGDPDDADQFGYSIGLSGDVAVIGSPGKNGAGSNRGAAYIFSRDMGGADGWGQLKKLTADDASDDVWLGTSVALDGALAVIGAGWDNGGGTDRGAAYLFGRDQGGADNWGQFKKLTASDAHDSAIFGYDVAVDGDYVVIGAGWSKGGGSERGQVYVFVRSEGGTDNWGEAQILRASDGANEDWFGFSVAIDGLYLLSGASGEDGAGLSRGAAYMFRKI